MLSSCQATELALCCAVQRCAVQLLGGPVLAAAVHGGWWGVLALLLSLLVSIPAREYTLAPLAACAVVGVLRMLPFYTSVPCLVVLLLAAAALVGGGLSQDSWAHQLPGTYKKLQNHVPRGADPAVAAVLGSRDYYEVRRL